MPVDDPHVLDDLVPAFLVGKVTAFALRKTVASVVVPVHREAAPDSLSRESVVPLDVFPETVQ